MIKPKTSRKYTYQFLNTYTKNDNNKMTITYKNFFIKYKKDITM